MERVCKRSVSSNPRSQRINYRVFNKISKSTIYYRVEVYCGCPNSPDIRLLSFVFTKIFLQTLLVSCMITESAPYAFGIGSSLSIKTGAPIAGVTCNPNYIWNSGDSRTNNKSIGCMIDTNGAIPKLSDYCERIII